MIYAVTEDGEYYSLHKSIDDANRYLEDLRKVYPDRGWDLLPQTEGRLSGQAKVIWGAECVVDVFTYDIHQWMKLYLWEGEVFKLPEVGEVIYKYLPMRFPFTGENDAAPEIRRRLRGVKFEPDDGHDFARRVS